MLLDIYTKISLLVGDNDKIEKKQTNHDNDRYAKP